MTPGAPQPGSPGAGLGTARCLLDSAGCLSCGLVSQIDTGAKAAARCPRCGARLARDRSLALQRTWACLAAATLAYVPANLLPVMSTASLFTGHNEHTLLGGIVELWQSGSWELALIVFVASIAVPVLKIAALALLAGTAQRGSRWRQHERGALYRLVQAVGHWSMLDVFVVVLLVAAVRFGSFATVAPEPGLLAFGLVVALTIVAAESFDPHLIWPPEPGSAKAGAPASATAEPGDD